MVHSHFQPEMSSFELAMINSAWYLRSALDVWQIHGPIALAALLLLRSSVYNLLLVICS
jgi:hypothetical protein